MTLTDEKVKELAEKTGAFDTAGPDVFFFEPGELIDFARAIESELQAQASEPVIVAPDALADEMNDLHGEAYGVDWVYPPTPTGYIRAYGIEFLKKTGHTGIDKMPQAADDIALFTTPQPASEPVAYRFSVGGLWFMCSSLNKALETVRDQGPIVIEPLFTTPQPAAPCPRCAELHRHYKIELVKEHMKWEEAEAKCAELEKERDGLRRDLNEIFASCKRPFLDTRGYKLGYGALETRLDIAIKERNAAFLAAALLRDKLTAANQQIASDKLLLDECEKALEDSIETINWLDCRDNSCNVPSGCTDQQDLLAKLKNRGGV